MRLLWAALILIVAGVILILAGAGGLGFIGVILIGPFPIILSGGESVWLPALIVLAVLLVFLWILLVRR